MEINEILTRPIGHLGLSDNFCQKSRLMGYSKLQDIIEQRPEEIFKRKGFSHIWFGELTKFLIEKKLIGLLQST